MTHLQASSVVSYLNSIYTGPLVGPYAGCAAFSDHRTSMVDFDCNWVYLVVSPFGAFLDGDALTDNQIHDAIISAMDKLGVPGSIHYPFLRSA